MFNKQKLAEYLEKEGMTCEAFAEAVGCSRQLVSFWRMGSKQPSVTYLHRIAEVTGTKMEDWLVA